MDFSNEQAVMVTGSSGWLGRAVVQKMKEKAPVVALYRHCLPEPQDKVYPVWCDLMNVDLIPAALRGVHTVVHLAWNEEEVGEGQLFKNVQAIKNLVTSMQAEGAQHLVVVSALGVSRDADSRFLKEKYEVECVALNSHIPYVTILRSGPLFGGQAVSDRFLRCVFNAVRTPLLHPEIEEGVVSPLHRDDMVDMILNSVVHKAQTGEQRLKVIEAVGPQEYSFGGLLCDVAASTGKGVSFGVKGSLGRFLLRGLEKKAGYYGRHLDFYSHLKLSKKTRFEGLQGQKSLEEALKGLPFQRPLSDPAVTVDAVAQATEVQL